MAGLRSLARRVLESNGYDVTHTTKTGFDPAITETVAAVRPFTMTTPARVAATCDALRYVERYTVPGDIVECGVWAGGQMMAAARTLLETGGRRDLYLFDTFEGMSPPTEHDRLAETGESAESQLRRHDRGESVWAYAALDDVRRNLASTGYPQELIHYVKGLVEATLPAQAPAQIAVLRLDTDWYESTRHELEHLIDRVSVGGVLIIDDYGHWRGAQKAVDEWLDASNRQVLLSRVDYSCRMAVLH